MPASYEPEALKAQVIACHTYAERMRRIQQKTPDPAFCGADLSDDCNRCQAYYNDDALRTLYGADYPKYYGKIAAAVDAAGDLLLCFDGEPAAAVFHAVSAGRTDSAEAVWGTALPYLIPVDSPDDRGAPDYLHTSDFPAETVKAALCAAEPDCVFGDDPAAWFSGALTAESGTVMQIQAGGVSFSGQRIREILGLRSAAFSAEYTGSVFRFTVRGFGHNVGMSQYGANEMAKKGSSFGEILLHYYPDTVLVRTAEIRSAVCAAAQPASQ
jgi:stage II sporulation protein D